MASSASSPVKAAITLTLLADGAPLSPEIMATLDEVEVTFDDVERSGFKVSFHTPRTAASGDAYDEIVKLTPSSQVAFKIVVGIGNVSSLVMDGYVLKQSVGLDPSGEGTVTLYGQDMSVLMDVLDKHKVFEQMHEGSIAKEVLQAYASSFDVVVKDPEDPYTPTQDAHKKATQLTTDYKYLRSLATSLGYRFYLKPDLKKSTMYWGPPEVAASAGGPLVLAVEPFGNLRSISVDYDALVPVNRWIALQDPEDPGDVLAIVTVDAASTAYPPLGDSDVLSTQATIRNEFSPNTSGSPPDVAKARAQARVDLSSWAVSAQGEVDVSRYGFLLQPCTTVELQGVHASHEGKYYVKSVTHKIRPGSYTQSFVLKRGGLASAA